MMAHLKQIPLYVLNFLHLLVALTCFGLFISQTCDIYDKFTKKMTTVGIRTYPQIEETKFLPCITVCPWQAFKKHGLFYNKKILLQETFGMDEIFVDAKVYSVFNKSAYSIEEIQSVYFGRCYMVCPVRPSKQNWAAYIFFNNSLDLKGLIFFY